MKDKYLKMISKHSISYLNDNYERTEKPLIIHSGKLCGYGYLYE